MMEKDEKLIVEEMIGANKNDIVRLKVREKYLQQKEITAKSGKDFIRSELGQVQAELSAKQDWVGYMERYYK